MSIIDAYELDKLFAKAEELEKAKELISDLKKKLTLYEDFIQHHNGISKKFPILPPEDK